jgi:hypothetical protein
VCPLGDMDISDVGDTETDVVLDSSTVCVPSEREPCVRETDVESLLDRDGVTSTDNDSEALDEFERNGGDGVSVSDGSLESVTDSVVVTDTVMLSSDFVGTSDGVGDMDATSPLRVTVNDAVILPVGDRTLPETLYDGDLLRLPTKLLDALGEPLARTLDAENVRAMWRVASSVIVADATERERVTDLLREMVKDSNVGTPLYNNSDAVDVTSCERETETLYVLTGNAVGVNGSVLVRDTVCVCVSEEVMVISEDGVGAVMVTDTNEFVQMDVGDGDVLVVADAISADADVLRVGEATIVSEADTEPDPDSVPDGPL